jgi:hypothetical protein
LQVTCLILAPPFAFAVKAVKKLITGAPDVVNTVSLDLYIFEITGESYDGSITVSDFFSHAVKRTARNAKRPNTENKFFVFRTLNLIIKKFCKLEKYTKK